MEYDLSKDSPEERERKRRALSDRYKETTFSKIKKDISDWWKWNEARRTGTLSDYYKNKQ